MKSILLDLDGAFYEGGRPIDGAAEAVDWLKARGIPHLYLTNTTSCPRSALVERLASMGIGVKAEQILTPPVAAVRWLKSNVDGDVAMTVGCIPLNFRIHNGGNRTIFGKINRPPAHEARPYPTLAASFTGYSPWHTFFDYGYGVN